MSSMANGIVKSKFIGSYTVNSSWETDSLGNPITIYNTVSSALGISVNDLGNTQGYGFLFRNNNASPVGYRCDFIYRAKDVSNGTWALRNNKSAIKGYNYNVSLYASEGTVIDVYEITFIV